MSTESRLQKHKWWNQIKYIFRILYQIRKDIYTNLDSAMYYVYFVAKYHTGWKILLLERSVYFLHHLFFCTDRLDESSGLRIQYDMSKISVPMILHKIIYSTS